MTMEEIFRSYVIELFKSMQPDIPVVKRFQNSTQPVEIRSGDPMCDITIERWIKVGTDYCLKDSTSGDIWWFGDRLVQVELELFSPNALSILTEFRDRLETFSYRNKMNEMGIMEQRTNSQPVSSTRMHGTTEYVESAKYRTRFHATAKYIDGIGSLVGTLVKPSTIEHGIINGNLITVTF